MEEIYYFITYEGHNRSGSKSVWNEVIDVSPMEYIKKVGETEDQGSQAYMSFVVLNTLEISKKEYEKFKGEF